MAWFWNSSPTDTTSPSKAPPAETAQSTPNPQDSATPSPNIDTFIQTLEAETSISSTKYQRVPQDPSPPHSDSPHDTSSPISGIEDDLLPTTISIRQAFDAAFYCQSLGGKFNDLYRYGELKSCGHHWKDFWFAMKVRSTRDPIKSEMIKNHFREKALKYKVGTSSEDVWKSRERMVEPEEAFSSPFPDDVGMGVREWNAMEEERRRRVVEMHGKEDSGGF